MVAATPTAAPPIRIGRSDLERAAAAGIIAPGEADRLWQFLATADAATDRPRFDVENVLWFGGALIVIAALGLFTTLAWDSFGGSVLALSALGYGIAAAVVAGLVRARGWRVAGGLLATIAVAMAPVAVFGLQHALGWWPRPATRDVLGFTEWLPGSGVFMASATILAGAIAFAWTRFAFLAVPITVALWLLAAQLWPWAFGQALDWQGWPASAVAFGGFALIGAWALDIAGRGAVAFWMHLVGLTLLLLGLSLQLLDLEVSVEVYAGMAVLLVALSVFLQRRAYAAAGAIGVAITLAYLASEAFADSLLFPVALAVIGVLIIGAGVLVHARHDALVAWSRRLLPPGFDRLRPAHARGVRSAA